MSQIWLAMSNGVEKKWVFDNKKQKVVCDIVCTIDSIICYEQHPLWHRKSGISFVYEMPFSEIFRLAANKSACKWNKPDTGKEQKTNIFTSSSQNSTLFKELEEFQSLCCLGFCCQSWNVWKMDISQIELFDELSIYHKQFHHFRCNFICFEICLKPFTYRSSRTRI